MTTRAVAQNGGMTRPIPKATTLVTDDGVAIEAVHLVGSDDVAIVLAPGFTLHWQHGAVWKAATRLTRACGVVTFDFRGHGRSGGVSTLGDREIRDVDVVLRYARELGYQRIATVGFSMGASIVLRHAALIGGADAVVSVSGPRRWDYPGTPPMRQVPLGVEHPGGPPRAPTPLDTRIPKRRGVPVPVP